jgi:prepilin-type N-terminal cleavage/methylation domain-containing protein
MRNRVARAAGFSLVEMIVVVFLLGIAMLGLLAVFDASTRINKSEQEVADAQGSVRYGIYQLTRVIRMAGAGGLYVTQAVLVTPDPDLPGITTDDDYDNVVDGSITNLAGTQVPIRPGTDIIEVRGVILSPLVGFDLASGCGGCKGIAALTVKPVTDLKHVNDNARRAPSPRRSGGRGLLDRSRSCRRSLRPRSGRSRRGPGTAAPPSGPGRR